MRIGFFTDTFLPQTNGVVTSILSSGTALTERGHEVHVFCPKTKLKEYRGIHIHSYPAVPFRPYPEFKIAVPQGREKVPPLDIVHTHSPFTMGFFGWRVSRFQKIPRVSTFHTLLSEYVKYVKLGGPFAKFLTWKLCTFFYNGHRKVVAPSRSLKKLLKEKGVKKPIEVIPNGIDLRLYHPIDKKLARKKLGLQNGRIFLSLGRLSYEKNLDVIIRAMEKADGTLLIAGRGPAKPKLQKLVKKIGLEKKVRFVGYIPNAYKKYYFSAADGFLIASTSETQAIVVAEAMACGCPVIGAKSLAIPEFVVNGKNGYLFEPNNIDELSEIIAEFEPSEKMSRAAIETAKKFRLENCVIRLEKFYASVL
ncbi:MAG: glycosyltransferase [Candidatus Hadarchaeales archaeon]